MTTYVGGLEAKTVAYALVFPALALMFYGKHLWMGTLLGLATSFRVLAGGYPMMVASAYLLLRQRAQFARWNRFGLAVLLYLGGAAFAIPAILTQLFSTVQVDGLKPSFIYVFIRLPHHLNPAAWPSKWWIGLVFYLSISAISLFLVKQTKDEDEDWSSAMKVKAEPCNELFVFAMIGLVPFYMGLLISPFDRTGAYLQYYPFRFGDMFLPFSTCLLFAAAVQHTVDRRCFLRRPIVFMITALIVSFLVFETTELKKNAIATFNFPKLPTEKVELYQWVSSQTEPTDQFITPPSALEEFSWVTERPMMVNLKLLPQTKLGIVEWYSRLNDLAGGKGDWSQVALNTEGAVFNQVSAVLADSYQQLDTAQVKNLLEQYQASYFVTNRVASVDLPVVFENSTYKVYAASTSK